MPPLPHQREELFCQAKAKGMTDSDAYVEAGYKPHRSNPWRLSEKERIKARTLELQRETHKAVVQHFIITKQYLVDALIENIEKALARIPVKIGKVGEEREVYLYRGEVVNNVIKMAGIEVGMFVEKKEKTHRNTDFADLTDEELLIRLRDEADALLIEKRAAADSDDQGGVK
jgi:phage terminase small subunit